jgi:hypothetical protein
MRRASPHASNPKRKDGIGKLKNTTRGRKPKKISPRTAYGQEERNDVKIEEHFE